MVFKLAVLPGDGIGPEVCEEALKVFKTVCAAQGIAYEIHHGLIGGCAVDATGVPLPEASLKLAQDCGTVLLGAVGDFKYDTLDPAIRPEQGLLQIRKAMGLFSNVRPVKAYPALLQASTLKQEVIEGVDIVVVRELTGGLYFGQPKRQEADYAVDTLEYKREEIERIAHNAFQLAQGRRKQVCSVDKANVLASSRLWRAVVEDVALQYPDVALTHQYVDNTAMQLILNPRQYDVILTENTFGDILSDEASMLTGSLGMLSSASYGQGAMALYEPSHGSAPTIAKQDKANPLATILSLTLLFTSSLHRPDLGQVIDDAVQAVLEQGLRTADIMAEGCTLVGTHAMGDAVVEAVKVRLLQAASA
ncbi:MAG: 3-isopropylmalate dehydrogenase [Vampirovibrionales bacterium]